MAMAVHFGTDGIRGTAYETITVDLAYRLGWAVGTVFTAPVYVGYDTRESSPVLAAAVLAGPEMMARLAAPFDWRDLPSAEVAKRIDAWIDPPHYTGEPPILLRALATYGARAKVSAPE